MEYQLNQVRGWTDCLTVDMIPESIVKELETHLVGGSTHLVRLKEAVVSRVTSTDTLYATTLDQTQYLCSSPLEVLYMKGTRALPTERLLAVIASPHGALSIPLCDIRGLSADEVRAIEEAKAAKERLLALQRGVAQALAQAQDQSRAPYRMLSDVFRHMPKLVEYYNTRNLADATATINDIESLMRVCSVTRDDTRGDRHIATLCFPDVKIRFQPDKVPSKMHKDLFGHVYSMGTYYVELDRIDRIPTNLDFLHVTGSSMGVRIGTRYMRNGLLHPHIDKNVCEDGLFWGTPCWGSYSEKVTQACNTFDIVGFAYLIKDFLGSCSESGWYGSVNYWNSDEDTYCTCGKMFIATEDDIAVECSSCSNRGVDIQDAQVDENL